jgi:translation elongation factor EF-1alpha
VPDWVACVAEQLAIRSARKRLVVIVREFVVLLIAGRSIIFTGKVASGEVHVGDNVFLQSPRGQIEVKVTSLEPSGFRVAGARAGDNVAVVVEPVNLEPVADGFRFTAANQISVESLALHSSQY